MAINIFDLVNSELGSSVISQMSSGLGESEGAISKGISGMLPAILGGMMNNAKNPSILDAITGAHSSGLLGNLIGGSSNNALISGVLNTIFGGNKGGIIDTIASFAGIGKASSGSLMNTVTAAALGALGKYAFNNKLGASGLTSLLLGNKSNLASMIPAGLSLGNLGLADFMADGSSTVKKAAETATKKVTDSVPADGGGGNQFWKWLLPLLALALLVWLFWPKGDSVKKAADAVQDGVSNVVDQAGDAVGAAGDAVSGAAGAVVDAVRSIGDIDLGDITLKGYTDGMEAGMVKFLKEDGYKNAADDEALKSTWYDFDRVNFVHGSSSELEEGSEEQLGNLVSILKAYPEAKVKIGGYTDKTGDEAVNKRISQERADFIKNWLADKGVGAQVTGAEGYGSEFATVSADASDEERAVDRKMAIRFSK